MFYNLYYSLGDFDYLDYFEWYQTLAQPYNFQQPRPYGCRRCRPRSPSWMLRARRWAAPWTRPLQR